MAFVDLIATDNRNIVIAQTIKFSRFDSKEKADQAIELPFILNNRRNSMLKRNLARIFVVAVIVCITYTDSFADIRIRFARGRTSATIPGSMAANRSQCYVAGASRGQTINATVSSRNGKVTFVDTGETSYSKNLERSGDHTFCVRNHGGATTYTLTVSIQ